MKAIEINEMRSVDGGYSVKCTKCGKTLRGAPSFMVSLFYVNHYHSKGSYVVYDYSFSKSANKWYG